MTAWQCTHTPPGRQRCGEVATFLASLTVGDGHHAKICTRHLAATCRRLAEISQPVLVARLLP